MDVSAPNPTPLPAIFPGLSGNPVPEVRRASGPVLRAGRLFFLAAIGASFAVAGENPARAGSASAGRCLIDGPVVAGSYGGEPALGWSTPWERGVVGFDVLAGTPPVALNPSLVVASNSPAGARYLLPASVAVGASEIIVRVWTDDGASTDHPCRIEQGGILAPGPAAPVPVLQPGVVLASASSGRPAKSGVPVVAALDVRTHRAGVCFLGYPELATAFQVTVDEIIQRSEQGRLSLSQQGVPVPSFGDPTSGGRYFFAPRTESLYFAGNVTQIRLANGAQTASVDVPPDLPPGKTEGRGRIVAERNLQGVSSLAGLADDDFWVWDTYLGGHPSFGVRNYPADLPGLGTGGGTVSIDAEIISDSETSHEFAIAVNGHALGSRAWSGRERRHLRFEADAAWLTSSNNIVQITSSGDRISRGYLDRFTVEYPRRLELVDSPLLFTATADGVLEVATPRGSVAEVWDVSTPSSPVRFARTDPAVSPQKFRFDGAAGHAYVAFLRGNADRQDGVEVFGPDRLGAGAPEAEYLVIAPEPLATAAGALAERRKAQGLSSAVVSLRDIQHEFGAGFTTPKALSAFLTHAWSRWSERPRYVVLVGDGTYDYQDNLGQSDNLVPPLVALTLFGRAVSDVLFGDIDHDGRPEIAIGRLPVHTEAELRRVVAQIDDYAGRTVVSPAALVVADRPDPGGEFIANAKAIGAVLERTFTVSQVFNEDMEVQQVHDLIGQRLAAGVDVFNYIGHGGRDRLGSGYLFSGEVESIDFGGRQPFVVAMTCAAGQFGLPGVSCLGEALLLKTGRSPVAVWSPSGFSIDFQAHQMNLLLADELSRQPVGTRLGDTLRRTLSAYRDSGGDDASPAIYNLLGDPALPLSFGAPPEIPPALSVQAGTSSLRITLAGRPATTYRIDVAGRLDAPDWRSAGTVATDAAGRAGFFWELSPDPGPRYFRAVTAP